MVERGGDRRNRVGRGHHAVSIITPGTVLEQLILPTSINVIDSQASTTNTQGTPGGSSTTTFPCNGWHTSSFTRFGLATYDLTFLRGAELITCSLGPFLRASSSEGTGGGANIYLNARRILRAYSPTQVTWNVYTTGNNWTTAGAQSNDNDLSFKRDGFIPVVNDTQGANYGLMSVHSLAKDALAETAAILRIIVGGEDGTDGGNLIRLVDSSYNMTVRYLPAAKRAA